MTIITNQQSSTRKVVKRPLTNSEPIQYQDEIMASSNQTAKKQKITTNQRQQSHEDYDFDYEKEDFDFDEDDDYSVDSGQNRCPQAGCGMVFDSEMELNEHITAAHFIANVMDLVPAFECLVEGCAEKFPNL